MEVDSPDEFRAKHPDNFPIAFGEDNPDMHTNRGQSGTPPTLADVHNLMLKRFAIDFHKFIYFKFEQRRSHMTYHTQEIVKAVLNLPAFEILNIKHEQEAWSNLRTSAIQVCSEITSL